MTFGSVRSFVVAEMNRNKTHRFVSWSKSQTDGYGVRVKGMRDAEAT